MKRHGKRGEYQVLMLSISQKTKIYLSIYSITSKHHIFSYIKIIERALNGFKKMSHVHLLSYLMWRRQPESRIWTFWHLFGDWSKPIINGSMIESDQIIGAQSVANADDWHGYTREVFTFIIYSSASPDTRDWPWARTDDDEISTTLKFTQLTY